MAHHFCLFRHEALPLCLAEVTGRKPRIGSPRKDGFVAFYCREVPDGLAEGARGMVRELDAALAPHLQAPGVYRCDARTLAAAYEALAKQWGKRNRTPAWIRWPAALLAVCLIVVSTAIMVVVVPTWLIVCAFRQQSGLLTAAETAFLYNLFDWRPTIRKLYAIWKS